MITEEVIEYIEKLIISNTFDKKDLVKIASWFKQIEKDRENDAWGDAFDRDAYQ